MLAIRLEKDLLELVELNFAGFNEGGIKIFEVFLYVGVSTHLSHVGTLCLLADASHLYEVRSPSFKEFHDVLQGILTEFIKEFDLRLALIF